MENALILTTSIMLTLLFFVVGGIVGWLANRHYLETTPSYIHPEFMDENGNIIPDEILAVRFENDYDDYDEEDDDE
jgi:hypothetical protein